MRAAFIAAAIMVLAAACGETQQPDGETETATGTGVAVRVLEKGYGRAVAAGDTLTVHTTGWLYAEAAPDHRGEKFWSSLDTGEKLTFTLGAGEMIRGWDTGLPGMLIGETRELTIPPDLAYGASGRGPIPPNATLVFEVELFAARTPEEAAGS